MTAKKKNFMTGALVLMVGGIIVKLIGALYKVPLGNLVSGDAMAYYTNAYDIYTFMYIIATAALPVVISRLVSEDVALGKYKQAKKTVRVAFMMFAVLGFAGMAFMLVFAKGLAEAMGSPESYCAILAIAPAIFFEALMSLYRGYFQGHQDMVPTAISQIIVAIIKAIFGYSLALWLNNKGYSMAIVAAGAIFGVTLGTVVGAVFLAVRRMFFKPEYNEVIEDASCKSSGSLAKKILWIMIPITISSSVLSVTNLLDAAVVQCIYTGTVSKGFCRHCFFPCRLQFQYFQTAFSCLYQKIILTNFYNTPRLFTGFSGIDTRFPQFQALSFPQCICAGSRRKPANLTENFFCRIIPVNYLIFFQYTSRMGCLAVVLFLRYDCTSFQPFQCINQ